MNTLTSSIEDVHRQIAGQERDRLAAIMPAQVAKAEQAAEKLRVELAAAEAGLEDHARAVSGIKALIVSYGRHRLLVAAFDGEFASIEPAAVFQAWQSAVENPCPQTQSQYNALLNQFALLTAITPHVEAERAKLLAKETELRDGVVSAAKAASVPLPKVLAQMRAEAGVNKETKRIGNEFVHRLFESGALDGLTKN